ncbi:hypothetical protein [Elioraea sp.]|uniref:hypothetical protein n=1 Tax=Elioraea sp. TaxID=2185103 RepID=UPI0025BC3480|nr:hypothetical protein [Elioraea sp.]
MAETATAPDDRVEGELAYLAMFGLERTVDVLAEIEGVRSLTPGEKRAGRAAVAALRHIARWWDADRAMRRADELRWRSGTHWNGDTKRPSPRQMITAVRVAAAAVAAIGGAAVLGEERDMTVRERFVTQPSQRKETHS